MSRRVADEAERERLRRILEDVRRRGGFIARTAALGKSAEELAPDRALPDRARRPHRAADARAPRRRRSSTASSTSRCAARATSLPDDCRRDPRGRRGGPRAPEGVPRRGRARALTTRSSSGEEPDAALRGRRRRGRDRERAEESGQPAPPAASIVIHQTEALVAIDVNTGRFVGQEGARGHRLRDEPRGRARGRASDPPARPRRADRRRLHRHGGPGAPQELFERSRPSSRATGRGSACCRFPSSA